MTGHRPSYLRRIIDLLVAENYHVIVAMPSQCFEHEVVKEVFSKHDTRNLSGISCDATVEESKPASTLHMLVNEYRCIRFYRAALRKAEKHAQVNLIFIQSLDDAVILSGISGLTFGGIPWIGIVIRQHFHFAEMGAIGPPDSKKALIKKRLFLRLLSKAQKNTLVMTIDRLLLDYVQSYYSDISQSLAYIPDAVDNRVSVTNPYIRRELGIPADAFVIMIYGSLRHSKGVNLLVDAMHKLPENIHVMLVGNQRPDVKACLQQDKHQVLYASKRLHEVDRYINVTEDANFFTAADLIWVGYKNYYSMSAVLVQAAQYRRPVLATNTGLVGWLAGKYQTGVVVDTTNQENIVSSIVEAVNNKFSPHDDDYGALVEAHSLKAFENSLLPSVKRLVA